MVVLPACSVKFKVFRASPPVQSSSHSSVNISRSGGAISRKTPLIPMPFSSPWRHSKRVAPPTRRSISQTAKRQSSGPYNQRFKSSGFVQASKTKCRGASKMRVIVISRSLGVVTFSVPLFFIGALPHCASTFFLLGFQLFQHAIQPLEIGFPNPPVAFDPSFQLLQRRRA